MSIQQLSRISLETIKMHDIRIIKGNIDKDHILDGTGKKVFLTQVQFEENKKGDKCVKNKIYR